MKNTFFERATDSRQYDSISVNWGPETLADSPFRKFFWEGFLPHVCDFAGKKVLDVGAGSGWLSYKLGEYGVSSVTGIEPSRNNVEYAAKLYPNSMIIESSLEGFITTEKFDIAVLNMSASHMKSLDEMFGKLDNLLTDYGVIYMTVPDYDYFKIAKWGQTIEVEHISDKQYVVVAKRTLNGVIADVVRTISCYELAAKRQGFVLDSATAMKPSISLIDALPRYQDFRDWAIAQFLVFKKLP